MPESECRSQRDFFAPDIIPDGGEDVLNLRLSSGENEVCCPLDDVIERCDADAGFK